MRIMAPQGLFCFDGAMPKRLFVRLIGLAGAAVTAIVVSAYKANPNLAIGLGVGIVIAGIGVWMFQRYEAAKVKRMVADIDAQK